MGRNRRSGGNMQSIEEFLEALSSGDPVPGGGSVAALEVAAAAALVAMVAHLTVGRKRYEQVEEEARQVAAEAIRLRDRAWALAQEDIDAYSRVAEVFSLPRSSEEEKAE